MTRVLLGPIRFETTAGREHKARAVEQKGRAQRMVLPGCQGRQLEVTCLVASKVNALADAHARHWGGSDCPVRRLAGQKA